MKLMLLNLFPSYIQVYVQYVYSSRTLYLLPKLDSFITFPRRLHKRHLDPGSESTRESPRGVIPLTLPHKVGFICTRESENTGQTEVQSKTNMLLSDRIKSLFVS